MYTPVRVQLMPTLEQALRRVITRLDPAGSIMRRNKFLGETKVRTLADLACNRLISRIKESFVFCRWLFLKSICHLQSNQRGFPTMSNKLTILKCCFQFEICHFLAFLLMYDSKKWNINIRLGTITTTIKKTTCQSFVSCHMPREQCSTPMMETIQLVTLLPELICYARFKIGLDDPTARASSGSTA